MVSLRNFTMDELRSYVDDCEFHFARCGCCAIPGALTAGTCERLATLVDTALIEAEREIEETLEDSTRDVLSAIHFSSVRCRQNRWDFKMPLTLEVREAVEAIVAASQGVLESRVSRQGRLIELACLISDPGAERQPLHPDTPCCTTRSLQFGPSNTCSPLLTIWVALQTVSMEMGPLILCPLTHTPEAHDALERMPDDDRASDLAVKEHGGLAAVCNVGTAILMDSRLLHCGGANAAVDEGGLRRRMFYTTWQLPQGDSSGGESEEEEPTRSIRAELRDRFCLADFIAGSSSCESRSTHSSNAWRGHSGRAMGTCSERTTPY